MRKLLYILSMLLITISCERRELTYNYDATVEVIINVDWSDMDTKPTGMSVYCYPESGDDAIVKQTNSVDAVSVNLPAGNYNILVFNQIPSDYGTITFSGLESFSTAEINAVETKSDWAKSLDESSLIRDPEDVAAATYTDLEITEEAVKSNVELKSKCITKSQELIYHTIDIAPQVVIKITRVKIRVSGIENYRSARATLYGMASGYNFSKQASHTSESTHLMESWTSTAYTEEGYDGEGEITASFTCFGLPGQTTYTRAEDYSDWDGVLDVDILLIDNSTIISESIELYDKITTSSQESKSDIDTDMDMNVDININSGFTFDSDSSSGDKPITLPDVVPEGSTSSGFDATVDDWGDEESYDIPI